MEADKENIVRRKLQTRIPVPLDPLPALPKRLLEKRNVKNCENQRCPLKTLTQSNINVASSSTREQVKSKKDKTSPNKFNIEVDAKYVTLRNKNRPELDNHIFIISDDEEENRNEVESHEQMKSFGDNLVTPSKKFAALHKSVRNIKLSLKRPHSRELQGLSPVLKDKKREEDKARRRLKFNETIEDRLQPPDYWGKVYTDCLNRDYTDDLLGYLLKTERKPLAVPRITEITRACVINWLMKVNVYIFHCPADFRGSLRLHRKTSAELHDNVTQQMLRWSLFVLPQTVHWGAQTVVLLTSGPQGNPAIVQSACWYLDTVLGTGKVKLDRLQLVAAACYWIAQKQLGPVYPVAKLVKCANYAFSPIKLVEAERYIMSKLKFPVHPKVPHEFVTYLAWWCDNEHPGEIEVAATFVCMTGLMLAKELCEEFPSTIACAAVRTVLLLLKKKEIMKHLLDCPIYKAAEKKTSGFSHTCSVLQRAVRTIDHINNEYKAPLELYNFPPLYIAQQLIYAANQ